MTIVGARLDVVHYKAVQGLAGRIRQGRDPASAQSFRRMDLHRDHCQDLLALARPLATSTHHSLAVISLPDRPWPHHVGL